MEIMAAIEKNGPFCAALEYMWRDILKHGNKWGSIDSICTRLSGAALWVECDSLEEDELRFLRNMLAKYGYVYEVKQEAA